MMLRARRLKGEGVISKSSKGTGAIWLKGCAIVAVTCLMSGCVATNAFAPTASAAEVQADTKVVKVVGQDVVLGRAAGYCFNDRQSRFTSSGAFVVMGPCDPTDEGSTATGMVQLS